MPVGAVYAARSSFTARRLPEAARSDDSLACERRAKGDDTQKGMQTAPFWSSRQRTKSSSGQTEIRIVPPQVVASKSTKTKQLAPSPLALPLWRSRDHPSSRQAPSLRGGLGRRGQAHTTCTREAPTRGGLRRAAGGGAEAEAAALAAAR